MSSTERRAWSALFGHTLTATSARPSKKWLVSGTTTRVRPGGRGSTSDRSAWPEPNLIHRVPQGRPVAEKTVASAKACCGAAGAKDHVVLADRLVPVVFPGSNGAAPVAPWQPPPDAAVATRAQTARPQPVEQARQILRTTGRTEYRSARRVLTVSAPAHALGRGKTSRSTSSTSKLGASHVMITSASVRI